MWLPGRYAASSSHADPHLLVISLDQNLLATAGHCFKHALDCQKYRFVFGYAYERAGAPLRIRPSDVYECRRARVQENDLGQTDRIRDYAIIELTRAVHGRPALSVRSKALRHGELLAIVSAANGVPLKIELGARVLDARAHPGDYFVLHSVSYRGSSGAPILDAAGSVVGLFVRGSDDFDWDKESTCYRASGRAVTSRRRTFAELPEEPVRVEGQGHDTAGEEARVSPTTRVPEQASYLRPALDALCASGYPSERICGTEPRCGGQICSPSENPRSCGTDRGDGSKADVGER